MDALTESQIIKYLKNEYHKRLLEVVNETDVFDDRGNMIIGKDLKVKHKKSQYEYTVDDVLQDPETEEIQIALRLPDEPRFDAAEEEDEVLSDVNADGAKILGEDDLVPAGSGPGDLSLPSKQDTPVPPLEQLEPEEEVIFFIDQEEFEKEYEVK